MKGIARCVLCRREAEFTDAAPKRCKTSEGGCGAAGAMTVLRAPSRARVTARYVPAPPLGQRARDLEAALERAALEPVA